MSHMELLMGGLKLMVFGIGMVFAFLVLMICAMKLMEKVLTPFKGALEAPAAPAARPGSNAGASGNDFQIAAAAVAAVEAARR